VVLVLGLLVIRPQAAGKVDGHASVNGKPATLTFAAAATAENLFDDKKKDMIVLLADHPMPAGVDAGDEVTVSLHARKGEFRAVMVRIDTTRKLINVKLFEKGLSGLLQYGAKDFELTMTALDAKRAAGRVRTKAPTKFDNTTLDLDATFDVSLEAAPAAKPAPAPAPAAAPAKAAAPAAAAPDASVALNKLLLKKLTLTPDDFLSAVAQQKTADVQLFLDAGMNPDTPGGMGTPLFGAETPIIWAIMMKNSPMALALVKAGANVKRVDKMGMIPLTWAVENCNAEVTQALVDARSDVNFKRAGMTMMQEAGACPAAAAILKKAGAK
jgi:autotransporter translocation and assembly factor TamB